MAIVKRGWDVIQSARGGAISDAGARSRFCLGGGLELALAALPRRRRRTRYAARLPEVMLGIVPGGAACVSPRLAGAPPRGLAVDGQDIDAAGRKSSACDECVPTRIMMTPRAACCSPRPAAAAAVPLSLTLNPLVRPIIRRRRESRSSCARAGALSGAVRDPRHLVKHDGDALAPPQSDPASIAHLIQTPTAMNLIRVFRLQKRLKAFGRDDVVQGHARHVVGAGTMGGDMRGGARARPDVTMQDQSSERLKPAMQRAGKLFADRLKDRGSARRIRPPDSGHSRRRRSAGDSSSKRSSRISSQARAFPCTGGEGQAVALLATNTSSIPLSRSAHRSRIADG